MKKILMVLLVFALAGTSVFALDLLQYPPPLKGGNVMLDVGIGYAFTGFLSSGSKMSIPPLFISAEFALPTKAPISVGGLFAIYQYKYNANLFGVKWSEKYTSMYFGARGNWHWNFSPKWLDFYTGINIGYDYFKITLDPKPNYSWYSEPRYGGFTVGAQVGAHFYFTDFLGVVVEAGYPYLIKAGLALKF